jgi:hypothetical protein
MRRHRGNPFWDRLLAGRSAAVMITMDTPPWYLRLICVSPVSRRWRKQILGFCGVKPIRASRFGPVRRSAAAKSIEAWRHSAAVHSAACAQRQLQQAGAGLSGGQIGQFPFEYARHAGKRGPFEGGGGGLGVAGRKPGGPWRRNRK